MTSFSLSTIDIYPSGSIEDMSPVSNQPSLSTASSSALKYFLIIQGPLTNKCPEALPSFGRVLPSESTIFISTPKTGLPALT